MPKVIGNHRCKVFFSNIAYDHRSFSSLGLTRRLYWLYIQMIIHSQLDYLTILNLLLLTDLPSLSKDLCSYVGISMITFKQIIDLLQANHRSPLSNSLISFKQIIDLLQTFPRFPFSSSLPSFYIRHSTLLTFRWSCVRALRSSCPPCRRSYITLSAPLQ